MIKGDYIEYEFDLYSIKNEDVIENFKKRFGSIITKKGLHYEIYEIDNDKMTGGSGSTFPYNKFEETLDTLLGKKNELSNNSKNLYDSLFSNFKGASENDIAKNNLENSDLSTQNEEALKTEPFLSEEKLEQNPVVDSGEDVEEDAEENVEEDVEEDTEEDDFVEDKTEEDAEDKTEEDAEEDTEDKTEENTMKTIIHVKLIVQHMKKLIDLEDIKKGKNL